MAAPAEDGKLMTENGANPASRRPSVLLVDDNAANRVALRVLLAELPLVLHEAESGNQALAMCLGQEQDLALILLDVQMPDMDGYEVAELLRGEEQTRNIPIIFLTAAYKDHEHQLQAYDAGAVDYIEKPVDDQVLLSKVRVFMQLWEQSQELHCLVDRLAEMNLELQAQTARLRDAEERLRHLSNHDPLTQLPNRNLLEQVFSKSAARMRRDHSRAALLFLDLDGFKPINDRLGHDVGDALLVEVGMRLRDCVREMDMAARFGGDEFVVLITDIKDRQEAADVASRIIAEITQPFEWEDQEIRVGVSIGIALFPDDADTQHGLILAADTAMYRAKRERGNDYVFAADL